MSVSDEIQKLDQLRRDGTLTFEEFEIAKRQVLGGSFDGAGSRHLEDLKAQNEVAQLDREWELARDDFMITGNHGAKHVPRKVSSVLGGVVVVAFGIFWTSMAATIPGPGRLVSLFGFVFILFGVGLSIRNFMKAGQYEEAQGRYKRRRKELVRESHGD
jgi:hypothetical protein